MTDRNPYSVLVVDDTPANLEILTKMLQERGHRPRPVPSGGLAVRAAEHEAPDLILMDINMPELNGFDTCRILKENAALADVPVLFISARTDTFDKLEAFKAGGVDYITKPFDIEEVTARVEMHLEKHGLQKALREKHEQLMELESLRDGLVHMVVHDMRSPLAVISMALDLLAEDLDGQMSDESLEDLESARASTTRLMTMINNLLDVSRLESGNMPIHRQNCDLGKLTQKTILDFGVLARELDVEEEIQDPGPIAGCDSDLIQRVMSNLLSNAFKYAEKKVTVRCLEDDEHIAWSVEDDGAGIPEDDHQAIFDKFRQARNQDRRTPGSGLGLAFCKQVIEAHGGELAVSSQEGSGSQFIFRLPMAPVRH